jgi:S-(hydroxymethyl)glutathione dehydrogenase/alcohol dehydrogenase
VDDISRAAANDEHSRRPTSYAPQARRPTMKAAVFHGPKQPLTIEQVDIDKPQEREVLVRTVASGVCHSDLHFVDGFYPYPTPAVLGHEAAGIVEEVGRSVTYVKPGDHVICCLSVFCGYCEDCMSGHPNRCSNRKATQRPKDGPQRLSQKGNPMKQFADLSTYAEKMLVHENALVKITNEIPLDRAALIGCGVTTGVGAVLNTARIEPGSTVAVFGCGGVGISAIQGARIAGARMIIAVDQFESKLAMAKRFGATHTIDASNADAVKAIQALTTPQGATDEPVVEGLGGAGGVDYAFEAVGLKKLAEQCFDCIKPGGTATIIGMIPVGQKVELDGPKFLTERKIQGTNMGSNRFRIDMPRYIDYYLQGRLNLDDMISRRGKLEDVNEAFRAMKAGEVARTVLMFE